MFPLVRLICLVSLVLGCRTGQYAPVTLPGDTAIVVTRVTIEPAGSRQLSVKYKPLYAMLGLRAKTRLYPQRGFNEYRLAEDHRRVLAFLHSQGRFDATVAEPVVTFAPDGKMAAVAWRVDEGPTYHLSTVTLVGAPSEHAAELRGAITFHPGDQIDLDPYRLQRLELATRLQDLGFGHARGYSRAFVDRQAKTVAWFFYLDPGPRTTIGSLAVEGSTQIPAANVLARAGFVVGQAFSTTDARRVELALLDTGAFASVNVVTDADIARLPEYPDTGGVLAPDQVAPDGSLVPRAHLPASVAVKVVVVEAPRRQLHLELGLEADPTRIDAFTGARVLLRHAFAPLHHLLVAATAGYGWIFGDDREIADGVYGSALAQYLHPRGFRMTARWRDTIYPAALLREFVVGPGFHVTLARGVDLETDAFLRHGRELDVPTLAMPTDPTSTGLELRASLIADRRDDRVEPTRGWFLGGSTSYAPGGPLGDRRWLQLGIDARGFIPLGRVHGPLSIALRASAGVVLLPGDSGAPLGARLFGGGAYGLRGFGRDRLSPAACTIDGACDVLVGGRSLVEASAELRFLPYRKQVGAVGFVDAGNAGAGTNAFEDGLALAAGAGARLRLWYLPIAIDVAYRVLDDSQTGLAFSRLLAFVRVGEAF
ncbi:MAG: BamA/TamA family outer membrane protein [Kofleriaceae bacterium]